VTLWSARATILGSFDPDFRFFFNG